MGIGPEPRARCRVVPCPTCAACGGPARSGWLMYGKNRHVVCCQCRLLPNRRHGCIRRGAGEGVRTPQPRSRAQRGWRFWTPPRPATAATLATAATVLPATRPIPPRRGRRGRKDANASLSPPEEQRLAAPCAMPRPGTLGWGALGGSCPTRTRSPSTACRVGYFPSSQRGQARPGQPHPRSSLRLSPFTQPVQPCLALPRPSRWMAIKSVRESLPGRNTTRPGPLAATGRRRPSGMAQWPWSGGSHDGMDSFVEGDSFGGAGPGRPGRT